MTTQGFSTLAKCNLTDLYDQFGCYWHFLIQFLYGNLEANGFRILVCGGCAFKSSIFVQTGDLDSRLHRCNFVNYFWCYLTIAYIGDCTFSFFQLVVGG